MVLLIVALVASGVAFHVRGTWEVTTTRLVETVHLTPKLTDEFRVLQISDFHGVPRPHQVDAIVAMSAATQPDLVALTGDLINVGTRDDRDLVAVEGLLAGLRDIGVPVFAVDGNHEHASPMRSDLHALYEDYGAQLLDDEHLVYVGPWGRVVVAAADDYYTGNGDVAAAVAGAPENAFRLLLTHAPDVRDDLAANGIDYAIVGHTHGGQISLPVVGAVITGDGLFPEYDKGRFEIGTSTMFIDSGVGVAFPRYRFLNQSQIVLHRISSAG